ncbi:hypothetical protein CICLE_v10030312mg [Citrus x clementina]|uniref:SWIM-type domain-containing protein n=1 Tax=Citrus clementina TaxID=85681 RepID=V4RQY4_CITCL|nr:hypothetical protein CICLE_v10030312mg [Citrus x clementina]
MALKCLTDLDGKPKLEIEFESEQLAYDFYNKYALKMRFSIRKHAFSKNKKASEMTSTIFFVGKQVGRRDSLGYTKQEQKNYARSTRQKEWHMEKRDLDNKEKVMNMFWLDARMIIDYGQFGDIVSFYTTYKVNKVNRPFAVFVGFNHHWETMVFGAALMLCTWHMMQNALKLVNSVFKGLNGVKSVLSMCMDCIEEENEFLIAWNNMLGVYDVHDNNWLKSIFELREKWTYAYVRRAWSITMKSTQLNESFDVSLKDFLKSDLNVDQFFVHFERINIICVAGWSIQKYLLKYGENFLYTIIMNDNSKERYVKREGNDTLSCSCRLFEMERIICSHIITLLKDTLNIKEIPD